MPKRKWGTCTRPTNLHPILQAIAHELHKLGHQLRVCARNHTITVHRHDNTILNYNYKNATIWLIITPQHAHININYTTTHDLQDPRTNPYNLIDEIHQWLTTP